MNYVYLIKKPDGESYCVASTREIARRIVEDDCANGNLNCDGPLVPNEVTIEELVFNEDW